MTKIQKVEVNADTSEESTPSLGILSVLNDAVEADDAAKLTLTGNIYTQCDTGSNYV